MDGGKEAEKWVDMGGEGECICCCKEHGFAFLPKIIHALGKF